MLDRPSCSRERPIYAPPAPAPSTAACLFPDLFDRTIDRRAMVADGWQGGESVSSTRYTVVYLTRTPDGRILFGSRGTPYAFGSKITDRQDTHEATVKMIRRSFVEWFPSLAGIRFTHAWGGPVGMPRDWMPAVRFDASSRIGSIVGYTGQGVSTSNLAGRLLAGLIKNRQTGLETLPLAQRRSPDWEMEPLRWLSCPLYAGSVSAHR